MKLNVNQHLTQHKSCTRDENFQFTHAQCILLWNISFLRVWKMKCLHKQHKIFALNLNKLKYNKKWWRQFVRNVLEDVWETREFIIHNYKTKLLRECMREMCENCSDIRKRKILFNKIGLFALWQQEWSLIWQ